MKYLTLNLIYLPLILITISAAAQEIRKDKCGSFHAYLLKNGKYKDIKYPEYFGQYHNFQPSD